MPRLSPHQLPSKEKKNGFNSKTVNSNRQVQGRGVNRKHNPVVLTSSTEGDSSKASSQNAKQVKAKVDTWRTRPSLEECERRRKLVVEAKQKKQGDAKNEQKQLSRKKAEKMLEEVNLLLTMSQVDPNLKTSKSYLRSIQRALTRGLKKCGHSKNGVDLQVFNFNPPQFKKQFNTKKNNFPKESLQNSSTSENSSFRHRQSFIDSDPSLKDEIKSVCSKNGMSEEINKLENEDFDKNEEFNQTNFKVRDLLSFWNEKLAERPMTVCDDHYNPHRCISLAKEHPRSVGQIQLSSDGVAEEHTLKPSQLKIGIRGASSIVEALKINSKNIRRTISQSAMNHYRPLSAKLEPNEIIKNGTTVTSEPVLRCEFKSAEMNGYKDRFLETRNNLLKKQSTFHHAYNKESFVNKNKWLTNYLQSVHQANKKIQLTQIQNGFSMEEMLKKEYFITITYPYLYIVKCLVGYTEEGRKYLLNPGIYRPVPKYEITSEPIDFKSSSYDYNQKYFNLRNYRALPGPGREIGSGDEYKMSLENISNITGIKPYVLNTLLHIMKKEENSCTVSRSDLEKLCKIGNELTKGSSMKDKLFSYLDSIENVFLNINDNIKMTWSKMPYSVSKYLPAFRIRRFRAMDRIRLQEKKIYFTVILSLIIISLIMLLDVSL